MVGLPPPGHGSAAAWDAGGQGEGRAVDRTEGMEIVGSLWELVSDAPSGRDASRFLRHVEERTGRIREDPDLSANLKMKADQVLRRCRVLFDAVTAEGGAHGDLDILAALARNAVLELKLVAERQLPSAEEEEPSLSRARMSF